MKRELQIIWQSVLSQVASWPHTFWDKGHHQRILINGQIVPVCVDDKPTGTDNLFPEAILPTKHR